MKKEKEQSINELWETFKRPDICNWSSRSSGRGGDRKNIWPKIFQIQ